MPEEVTVAEQQIKKGVTAEVIDAVRKDGFGFAEDDDGERYFVHSDALPDDWESSVDGDVVPIGTTLRFNAVPPRSDGQSWAARKVEIEDVIRKSRSRRTRSRGSRRSSSKSGSRKGGSGKGKHPKGVDLEIIVEDLGRRGPPGAQERGWRVTTVKDGVPFSTRVTISCAQKFRLRGSRSKATSFQRTTKSDGTVVIWVSEVAHGAHLVLTIVDGLAREERRLFPVVDRI